MSYGPVELVLLRFDGTDFRGEVLREIQKLVDEGTISVIDILVAVRFGDEPVRVIEVNELEDQVLQRFEPIMADVTELLTEDDAITLTADLEPDSAMAILVFEHRWVSSLADAIEGAGGSVVMTQRIPRAVIDQVVDELVAKA
jgi:hypothetical protein